MQLYILFSTLLCFFTIASIGAPVLAVPPPPNWSEELVPRADAAAQLLDPSKVLTSLVGPVPDSAPATRKNVLQKAITKGIWDKNFWTSLPKTTVDSTTDIVGSVPGMFGNLKTDIGKLLHKGS